MESIMIHRCSLCGKSFVREAECFGHEASHFGVSPEEYHEWLRLRKAAADAGYAVGRTKNRETDAAFDEACRTLCDFEIAHGLEGESQPIRV